MVTASSASKTCCSETSCRAAQGPEPLGGGLGALDRHLGLLDRQLVGPPLLAPGQRLEQRQRGLEPVARRRLLREVGLGNRLVELDDRLALLDRLPCLTTSSWTCPSTAGVSVASLAGIASLRPRPSTVWTIVPRRAASTRTVTWASSAPECPSFASAVWLSLRHPASPTQSSPTSIHHRPVMPLLPRSQSSIEKSRRTLSPHNISGGRDGQYGQAS